MCLRFLVQKYASPKACEWINRLIPTFSLSIQIKDPHSVKIPHDAALWFPGDRNRGLTWSRPCPRTWAAAIRSLLWLAYREGGRDGKHENIGNGRRRKEGIAQWEPHPWFSRTQKWLMTQGASRRIRATICLMSTQACTPAKQAWPSQQASRYSSQPRTHTHTAALHKYLITMQTII